MLVCVWLCDVCAGHYTQCVLWRADGTTVGWPWKFYIYRWLQLCRTSLNCQLLQREQGGFDHFVQRPLEGSPPHRLFKSALSWSQSLLVFETIDRCFVTHRGTIQFCHHLTLKMVKLPTSSTSHLVNSNFVNSHSVNIDQMGIDKVGSSPNGNWRSGNWQSGNWRSGNKPDVGGGACLPLWGWASAKHGG